MFGSIRSIDGTNPIIDGTNPRVDGIIYNWRM
jgi:hypothetical protein